VTGRSSFGGRTAAVAPSAGANFGHAYHGHGYYGHGYGGGFCGLYAFGGPAYYGYDYSDGCWVRRLVPTPYGLRWRLVDVCD
jgi:hypothetical protein